MTEVVWFSIKNGNYDFVSFWDTFLKNQHKEKILVRDFVLCALYDKLPYIESYHIIIKILNKLNYGCEKYLIYYQLIKNVRFINNSSNQIEYLLDNSDTIIYLLNKPLTIVELDEILTEAFYLLIKSFFPYYQTFPILEVQKYKIEFEDFNKFFNELENLSLIFDYNKIIKDGDNNNSISLTNCYIYYYAIKDFIEFLKEKKYHHGFILMKKLLLN